jgi:apolipoprotein D and lipocalin family protein
MGLLVMTSRIAAIVALVLVALSACKSPPVNRDPSRLLPTVAQVDLERYLGRWYEIARYENSFETDCVGVTATYGRKPDGTISVTNRCLLKSLNGEENIAEGSARVVDTKTNAKLAVTFFWPFEGDYWVIGLADDYSWVLVGEPGGRYLWILARTPQISPELKAELVGKLDALGYNTKALHWTLQPVGLSQ